MPNITYHTKRISEKGTNETKNYMVWQIKDSLKGYLFDIKN